MEKINLNDRHKIIANNVIKSHELGKMKGTELTFENLVCVHTGQLKKLFSYAIFQKFFHIFKIHSWSMFYHTCTCN